VDLSLCPVEMSLVFPLIFGKFELEDCLEAELELKEGKLFFATSAAV
jgi:hypothetical protein